MAISRFQYPKTPDDPDVPPHVSRQFAEVHRLYGSGDINSLTRGASTPAPWPRAGRLKGQPLFDQSRVSAALSSPRELTETDPRFLHANQPSVTREGVQYYMGNEYERTGRTFADRGDVGNRSPVVYRKVNGQNVILSGHHRAAAALLRGERFHALHVEEDDE